MSTLRILAVLALAFAPRAEACSCVLHKGTRAEQVLEALNDYGVVFVARLMGRAPCRTGMCSRTIPLNVGGDKDLAILREFIKHPPKRP